MGGIGRAEVVRNSVRNMVRSDRRAGEGGNGVAAITSGK